MWVIAVIDVAGSAHDMTRRQEPPEATVVAEVPMVPEHEIGARRDTKRSPVPPIGNEPIGAMEEEWRLPASHLLAELRGVRGSTHRRVTLGPGRLEPVEEQLAVAHADAVARDGRNAADREETRRFHGNEGHDLATLRPVTRPKLHHEVVTCQQRRLHGAGGHPEGRTPPWRAMAAKERGGKDSRGQQRQDQQDLRCALERHRRCLIALA